MPDYSNTQDKLNSIHRALELIDVLVGTYNQVKAVQSSLLLYQAGTDQVFNDAIDASFTLQERQELNQMLSQLDALATDWETNHSVILGLSP
jgi:DNA invertase Pin-like site-specific DNA recombinase